MEGTLWLGHLIARNAVVDSLFFCKGCESGEVIILVADLWSETSTSSYGSCLHTRARAPNLLKAVDFNAGERRQIVVLTRRRCSLKVILF